MKTTLKNMVKSGIDLLLSPFDVKLARRYNWEDQRQYLPFKKTIAEAKKSGLSLGDYIDMTYDVPGSSQKTIEEMEARGVFTDQILRVCEIGPGSGRYLEKLINICHPAHYEIYETAAHWGEYLANKFHVLYQKTDGMSLAATPSNSVDLVHAHKVFPATRFLTTISYYNEMARVVREGGKVVFDIVTEECMKMDIIIKWLSRGAASWPFPNIMPKQFTLSIFQQKGLRYLGGFHATLEPGITEYLIFAKTPPL